MSVTLKIEITAETGAAVNKALAEFAGGSSPATVATDMLIHELRERLWAKGLVLQFDPAKVTETAVDTPVPLRTSRKPKPTTAETVPAVEEKVEEAQPAPAVDPAPIEEPKKMEPSTKTAEAMAVPTRDEVIAALNAYAGPRGGQVAGRQKMQEVCGVARLQDIKPEDYPKLVAALAVAQAA